MEENWLFLRDAATCAGLSVSVVRHRVAAYNIPSRKMQIPGRFLPPLLQIRESDLGLLARKPRAAWKPKTRPTLPDGWADLATLSAESGIPADALRKRVIARGVPHRKENNIVLVPREDAPRLVRTFTPPPPTAPMARTPPIPQPLADPSIQDGGGYVVRGIAAQFRVDVAKVYSDDRSIPVVEVRHIAAASLSRLGMANGRIAKHLGRDHATILNSLNRVRATPALTDAVDTIVGKARTGNLSIDLDSVLERVLLDTRMSVIAAIRSYLRGTLLGWEKHDQGAMASGLAHLAGDKGVRKAVATVLKRLDLAQHIGRMEAHIVASGYRRAAS